MTYKKIILVSSVSLCLGFGSPLLLADETDPAKFSSTDSLIETLLSDDKAELGRAQAELDQAVSSGATNEQIAALQAQLDAAKTNLNDEAIAITGQVDVLTDEQIIALNRSLNNAVNSKLDVDIDSEDIQDIIDGKYDNRQINALTKALEEEAKFTALSDKFLQKLEDTGNEKFGDQSDRMLEKADSQKDKFLGKIDKFDKNDLIGDTAVEEARQLSKQNAKDSVNETAKKTAKDLAKQMAKSEAKLSAKANAKDTAKQAANQIVKEEGKQAAKGLNKENGKSKQ